MSFDINDVGDVGAFGIAILPGAVVSVDGQYYEIAENPKVQHVRTDRGMGKEDNTADPAIRKLMERKMI